MWTFCNNKTTPLLEETCTTLVFLCWECLQEEDPPMKCLKMVKIFLTLLQLHFLVIFCKFWSDDSFQQMKASLVGSDWNLNSNVEKCLVSLFRIELACSMESPKEKMNLVNVSGELNRISLFLPGTFVTGPYKCEKKLKGISAWQDVC